MITSKSNPKIKWVRRLQTDRRFRRKEASFVVEGTRWLIDLIQLENWPVLCMASESWLQNPGNRSLSRALPVSPLEVDEKIMKLVSSLESPPGILAVLSFPRLSIPEDPSLLLLLDRIGNPGNLGSLLRSAAASGADGAIMSPGCADPFNPKALRGGMGAQIRLPMETLTWSEIKEKVSSLQVLMASSPASSPVSSSYFQVDWLAPSALIISSEAAGPSHEAADIATSEISIPMKNDVDSLNAAAAGAVIMFEAARQRLLE